MYIELLFKNARSAWIVLKSLDRVTIEYALRLEFKATNDIAKYEALPKGLYLV